MQHEECLNLILSILQKKKTDLSQFLLIYQKTQQTLLHFQKEVKARLKNGNHIMHQSMPKSTTPPKLTFFLIILDLATATGIFSRTVVYPTKSF